MDFNPGAKLLGMCLRQPKIFEEALAKGLSTASFADKDHRRIFVAMLEAERAGRPADAVTMELALPELGPVLAELRREAPASMNASYFVDELLAAEWTARASRTLHELTRTFETRKPYDDISPQREAVQRALDGLLSADAHSTRGLHSIASVLEKAIPLLEQKILDAKSGKTAEIPTGITALDRLTSGGLRRGSVNVFAARTGQGKTTLALNLAHHAASAGFAVGYFTVEMPAVQLAMKLLSLASGIRGSSILNGILTEGEIDKVWAAARTLYNVPLWIDDNFMASYEAFERACRKRKRAGALDVIVVDYVQQLSTATRHQSRHAAVSEVSHKLKQLALELELAVISLAQFNRDAEKEDVPSIWQIKDSGAIEQDCDLGVCLYRDDHERFFLKVDKNRWGKDRVQFLVDADLSVNVFRNANINLPGDF